jgi:hypothetical protein
MKNLKDFSEMSVNELRNYLNANFEGIRMTGYVITRMSGNIAGFSTPGCSIDMRKAGATAPTLDGDDAYLWTPFRKTAIYLNRDGSEERHDNIHFTRKSNEEAEELYKLLSALCYKCGGVGTKIHWMLLRKYGYLSEIA